MLQNGEADDKLCNVKQRKRKQTMETAEEWFHYKTTT